MAAAPACKRHRSAATPGGDAAVEADNRGFPRDPEDPRRRVAPTNARNKGPILEVLLRHLPTASGDAPADVLEIASGTGEHVAHFAASLPELRWQPSEWSGHANLSFERQEIEDVCSSISAWAAGLPNVLPPIALDASAAQWPPEVEAPGEAPHFVGILASNVAHIAPPQVLHGLLRGAGRILKTGGHLFLYGPFKVADQELAEGNAKFDASLRAVDSSWGLRTIDDVVAAAAEASLSLSSVEDMPANNKTLVFVKVNGAP